MTSDQSQVKTEELAGTLEIGSGGNLKVQDLQIPVNDAENDVKQANLLGGDFDEGSGAKKKKKRSQVKVACGMFPLVLLILELLQLAPQHSFVNFLTRLLFSSGLQKSMQKV